MSSFLDKLGRNFLIATFIPSLGFVFILSHIFSPILPFQIKDSVAYLLTNEAVSENNQIWGTATFIFVLTLLLGYTLRGLETFIYKTLEGYYLFRSSRWRKRQRKKALRRLTYIKAIDKHISYLQEVITHDPYNKKLGQQLDRYVQKSHNLKAEYRQDYPPQPQYIMPTRFGNILRAAEHYPEERYKMNAVTAWPRLIYAIDPDYYNQIDQSNNGLAFVVNSMVLSALLALMCLIASIHQFMVWGLTKSYEISLNSPQVLVEFGWLYLGGVVFFMGVAYFFYNASLPAAKQYGNMIRSAYDLFRFDLRKQLRLPLPADSDEDRQSWERWSEFVAVGDDMPMALPFEYQYMEDEIRKSLRSENELFISVLEEEESRNSLID